MYSKRNATGSFWKGNSYRFSKCSKGEVVKLKIPIVFTGQDVIGSKWDCY